MCSESCVYRIRSMLIRAFLWLCLMVIATIRCAVYAVGHPRCCHTSHWLRVAFFEHRLLFLSCLIAKYLLKAISLPSHLTVLSLSLRLHDINVQSAAPRTPPSRLTHSPASRQLAVRPHSQISLSFKECTQRAYRALPHTNATSWRLAHSGVRI